MAKRAPTQLSAIHFNGRERRRSPRVRYDVETYIEVSEGKLDVHLIDVSQSGCSFSSDDWQPKLDESYQMKLALPGCDNQLSIKVKICSRLGTKSGVEFVQMDAVDSSRLQELLGADGQDTAPPGFFSG